jgi:hypothetical protein
MRGVEDEEHLRYAAAHQCAVVTTNVRDFLTLHQTWQEAGQQHAGILALYRENNPRRDMTYMQIARAISRLERTGLPIENLTDTASPLASRGCGWTSFRKFKVRW